MALTKTTKQGYERYFVYGEFADVLDEDETITSQSVLAVDADGVDAKATVIDDAATYISGTRVYVRVKDGAEADGPYKFTIRCETNKGNRWEVDGTLALKET